MGRTRPVALGLLRVGTGHKTPGTKRQILPTSSTRPEAVPSPILIPRDFAPRGEADVFVVGALYNLEMRLCRLGRFFIDLCAPCSFTRLEICNGAAK